ncbi:MAG: class I SAM-dependent methyltransferase [Dokdonella sp.]
MIGGDECCSDETGGDEIGDFAASGYAGYNEWKHWSGPFECSQKLARNLAAEFKQIPLRDKHVLEIGFGNGGFLAWAKEQGAQVSGIEINPELVQRGVAQGYAVRMADLEQLANAGERYDVIVALDVFEHWSTEQLIANLRHIAQMLSDGGIVLARFPNGHSPFGRIYQHGDFTHQSVLSIYKIRHLAVLTGLEIVRVSNAKRVPSKSGIVRAIRHGWRALRRARIEILLGKLYGTPRLPLDPNLVVVMRKPTVNSSTHDNDGNRQ